MEKLWKTLSLLTVITVIISGVVSASHVMRRSDDSNPLEAVVSRLAQDVATLEAKVQALENSAAKKAAFHGIRLVSSTLVAKAPIKFAVGSQVGGGYSSATGIYTAPFSGWYTIHARIYLQQAASFYTDLYNNGNIVSRYRCEDEDAYFTCSWGVTLHVSAGDQLWLQPDTYSGPCFNAGYDNVFSVVLVMPD